MLKCQMILFIHNGTYSFSRIIQAKGRETQKYMSLIHSVESAKVQISRIQAYQEGGGEQREQVPWCQTNKMSQTWMDEEKTDCDATA